MAAQTESPFWYPRELGKIHREMREAFRHVEHYWGAIPTYPSGSWTWAFASNDRQPGDHFDARRAGTIEPAHAILEPRGAARLLRTAELREAGHRRREPFAN